MPTSGAEIAPNIRLVRPLGRGGMGVLWLAEHRTLRTEVVVKFLNDELAGDPSNAKAVAREAAAAARVRSAHIVQILDHGVREGVPFIVMEHLRGCDLRRLLETRGTLSKDETTIVIGQLARALARTHAEGIVHRDVKPSNVFLTEGEGEIFVKLLDFGLAKSTRLTDATSTTGPDGCAGTPPYMSPEQITGTILDARSDVWSLGVVAFQCLTGKRPFEGETWGAIAVAIHTLPLPRITALEPGLPAEIDGWFARICARALDERFASAIEASDAMARALGTVVPRRPDGPSIAGSATSEPGSGDQGTLVDEERVASRRAGSRKSRIWIGLLAIASLPIALVATGGRASSNARLAPAASSRDGVEVSLPTVGFMAPSDVPQNETISTPAQPPAPAASVHVRPQVANSMGLRHRSAAAGAPSASTHQADVAPATTSFELPDERR
jgi:serine/threonine-protein kinase